MSWSSSPGAYLLTVSPLLFSACAEVGSAREPSPPDPPRAPASAVAARGRLQPKHGLLRLAGPSDMTAVVLRLAVEEGDRVRSGQVVATLDTLPVRRSRVTRLEAQAAAQEAAVGRHRSELASVRKDYERYLRLSKEGIVSTAEREVWETKLEVAEARLREAEGQLASARAEVAGARVEQETSLVRSPVDGTVVKIHTRAGEKVGPEGIAALARGDGMYALAEVYETDVARVKVGQRATVRSPALPREVHGTVERVGLRVGRLSVLGNDPAAKTDARIVEVEIKIDDAEAAFGFNDLEVDVLIDTAPAPVPRP